MSTAARVGAWPWPGAGAAEHARRGRPLPFSRHSPFPSPPCARARAQWPLWCPATLGCVPTIAPRRLSAARRCRHPGGRVPPHGIILARRAACRAGAHTSTRRCQPRCDGVYYSCTGTTTYYTAWPLRWDVSPTGSLLRCTTCTGRSRRIWCRWPGTVGWGRARRPRPRCVRGRRAAALSAATEAGPAFLSLCRPGEPDRLAGSSRFLDPRT